MNEALITGVVGIVVCVVNNYFQNRKTVSLIEYRLKALEDKVGKHNHLDVRLHELEAAKQLFDEKLRVANHRIDDLEHEKKGQA